VVLVLLADVEVMRGDVAFVVVVVLVSSSSSGSAFVVFDVVLVLLADVGFMRTIEALVVVEVLLCIVAIGIVCCAVLFDAVLVLMLHKEDE